MSPRAEHTNSELAALFQALPDLVLTVEPDGTIVDIKPGLEEIPYMEAADLLGRRLQDHEPRHRFPRSCIQTSSPRPRTDFVAT